MGVADAHNICAGSENAGVNRPFIGRGFRAAEIVAVEIQHDQPIQRRAAGAYTGYRNKSLAFGNAHAHMAEAIGDAFVIEDVTAIHQFLLEFFEFAGIESGYV